MKSAAATRRTLPAAIAAALTLAGVVAAPAHAQSAAEMSLEELMAVRVVSASKYLQPQRDVAAAVRIITKDDILAFGWTTVAEALASLPGVHFSYDRQFQRVGVRGLAPIADFSSRLLVLIDGVRVNEPVYDAAPLGHALPIDLALVERIEYIPGPGSAVYGQNAMLGVVNLITRSGASFDGAQAALEGTSRERTGYGRATFGHAFDSGLDVVASVTALRSRGQDLPMEFPNAGPVRASAPGVAAGMDGERDREAFLRASWRGWKLATTYGDHRKDDPTSAYFTDPLVPGQYHRERGSVTSLSYSGMAGSALEVSGRAFAGRASYLQLGRYQGFWFTTRGESRWYGAELQGVTRVVAGHTLMAGLEFQDNERTDLSFDSPMASVDAPGNGRRLGVYVQDEWRWTPALLATVGLRLDRNDGSRSRASPRAAIIWAPGPDTTVKALYGRASREADAFERHFLDGMLGGGAAAPGGETVDTGELHLDHRFTPTLVLDASVYAWRLADPIVQALDPATGFSRFATGASRRATGVEASLTRAWPGGGRVVGVLSYQDEESGDRGGENAPHVLARVLASAPVPGTPLRAAYEWRYDSSRLALDGTRTGGYGLSNLNLYARFPRLGLDVGVRVTNLFDKRYAYPASAANWQVSLPQDGRAVKAWLQWTF